MCFISKIFKKKEKLVYPHRDNFLQWESEEQQALILINRYRILKGLPLVKADETIRLEAENRAVHIATSEAPVTHNGSGIVFKRLLDLGIVAPKENLGWGYKSGEGIVNGWYKSASHCRVMMNPKNKYCGIGYAVVGNRRIWVAIFGR